jgi:hypothetical protein
MALGKWAKIELVQASFITGIAIHSTHDVCVFLNTSTRHEL